MQIRGEYPAEPPPAYEDPRHHVSTPNFDLPPPRGVIAEASNADQTPSTERSGLLGELLDRFSEPDSEINRHQQQQQPDPEQPNLGSIGDHKIQTDVPHPTIEPETLSQSIPQQDRKRCTSTGSKPLSGTFPLYDSLSLTTHSGSLNATVLPQPANPLIPLPAELRVHSHSGSIKLDTQIPISGYADDDDDDAEKQSRAVWQRRYRTAVTSHSSRIDAKVVLGEKTLVQSHSGVLDVEAVVVPRVLDPHAAGGGGGGGETDGGGKRKKDGGPNSPPPPPPLSLHTQTHSSSQNVRVVDPCTAQPTHGASSMTSLPQQQQQQQKQILTTYHHTHSGKLQLYYPATWTGKIEGTMGKSKAEITIHGTGVDVIQQTPTKFLAKRRRSYQGGGGMVGGQEGEEGMANTLRFYSFSGRVEIFFG
ncbi:hypothetical protein KC333_g6141 [Hortaea werneckii]|nr:hypothetical protein KC333_g6141 [Hortaea werneckii]KAI7309268.1 hypothetical protein KC326_g7087 [Hortaea werneckii]